MLKSGKFILKKELCMHLSHPVYSYILVALQFILIGLILLTGSWFIDNFSFGLILQALSIVLALWAVKTMRLGKFNIIPDPKNDSKLIKAGPYRFIRHPMYASILLFFIPLIIQEPSTIRIAFYIALALTLVFKLHYEEKLLAEKFTAYSNYQKQSHKLIPFIY